MDTKTKIHHTVVTCGLVAASVALFIAPQLEPYVIWFLLMTNLIWVWGA